MHLHEKFEEKGVDELAHPDLEVRSRMSECTVSDCQNGCKYYHDSDSDLVVLMHNASYGCRRTAADIQANPMAVDAVKVHESLQGEVWVDPVESEVAQ